jgi:hypothetical protein
LVRQPFTSKSSTIRPSFPASNHSPENKDFHPLQAFFSVDPALPLKPEPLVLYRKPMHKNFENFKP